WPPTCNTVDAAGSTAQRARRPFPRPDALLVGPLRRRRASCNLPPAQLRRSRRRPQSRVRLESLMKKLPLLVACFLVFSGFPSAVSAQSTGGSVSGTVKDATGAVLPGVTVLVTKIDTSTTRTVV